MTLFVHPMTLPFYSLLWLLPPLCLGVAIIYKTIRTDDIRRLPRQVLGLAVYMAGGLAGLGAGLWLILRYWP